MDGRSPAVAHGERGPTWAWRWFLATIGVATLAYFFLPIGVQSILYDVVAVAAAAAMFAGIAWNLPEPRFAWTLLALGVLLWAGGDIVFGTSQPVPSLADMFYISAYFEARRDVYYERLLAVSRDGDWTGWARFFLAAVKAQAEDNLAKTRTILDLYEAMKPRVAEMTHSQYSIHALDWMFEHPIFKTTDFVSGAGIPSPTAKRLLSVLRREAVLATVSSGSGRRAAVLAYPELLRVAEGLSVS